MEGMMALLLENGLGLCDWDSSYLEPASLSSEQEAAREAVSPLFCILQSDANWCICMLQSEDINGFACFILC
jgi:hypothetical protein